MALTRLELTHTVSSLDNLGLVGDNLDTDRKRNAFHALGRLFKAIAGGFVSGFSMRLRKSEVKASGTVTFSSIVEDDTVTINGVVFTGKDSPSGEVQFETGVSDTSSAASLAAKINACTDGAIENIVSATSAAEVVTVTCVEPGVIGNICTLAISDNGTVSGATLENGSNGTTSTFSLV